mmetsp:Transcript_13670/g.40860  ORF Transcript_13670/g.40860 Transcript_13670/m.40860 type:complete len:193 (+) Transcript_13670:64-642(+)
MGARPSSLESLPEDLLDQQSPQSLASSPLATRCPSPLAPSRPTLLTGHAQGKVLPKPVAACCPQSSAGVAPHAAAAGCCQAPPRLELPCSRQSSAVVAPQVVAGAYKAEISSTRVEADAGRARLTAAQVAQAVEQGATAIRQHRESTHPPVRSSRKDQRAGPGNAVKLARLAGLALGSQSLKKLDSIAQELA